MRYLQTLFYVIRQYRTVLFMAAVILAGTAPTALALPGTADDSYGVPFDKSLVVESEGGVLENDSLAGESGVTAELVGDPTHGTLSCDTDVLLKLCPDGSFIYDPGLTFSGTDIFTYRVTSDTGTSNTATVTLTACTGGPDIFSCWQEASYLAKLTELGYIPVQEGFENDSVWGSVRTPDTAESVISMGIKWQTNHPLTNQITTGVGAALTGDWGVYDPEHGYADVTFEYCKTYDDPAPECFPNDGFTGIRETGQSKLYGVGGFITTVSTQPGPNVDIILDGNLRINMGELPDTGYHFFGVIDAGDTGFNQFQFQEIDGKVTQRLHIFGDDFTFAVPFGLEHALSALQVMTGIQPGLRLSLGADVNNDGRIGMSEAIFILREVAGLP